MIRMDTAPFKKPPTSERAKKLVHRYWPLLLVIVLFIAAFWIRSFPARFNELQALDPFYIYRMSEYVLTHNFQLPDVDIFRYYPIGSIPIEDEFAVPLYLPAIMYTILPLNMPFFQFALFYPAIMGALGVVVMFFIGREIYDWKAGFFAAFFLATIPAFITRTSAGFFDKEPTFGFFTLASILFFIAAYKRDSWKLGAIGGVFLGLAGLSSGIGRFLYIFYFFFAITLLVINRYRKLLYSYVPVFIFGVAVQLIIPKNNLGSSLFLIFAAVFLLILIRYGVERFKLVPTENLKYVTPILLVVVVVGVLVGSIFLDSLYNIVSSFVALALVQNLNPVGYTVAEQQPGNWNTLSQLSGLQFSVHLLPQLQVFAPIMSIFFLMFVGMFIMAYLVVRYRQWHYLVPLFWILASIWSVFLFIRLVFLFGPPAALIAGFGVAWLINKFLSFQKYEKYTALTKHFSIVVVALVAVLLALNGANAYSYGNGLGPSICFPNEQILIDGQRCLNVNEDGSFTFAQGQPWYEAMTYMREETPTNSNILTWWDFGHWFHMRGERGSVADGGKGDRPEIAFWYTAPVEDWDLYLEWMRDRHQVTHILQDFTLPGKYGAISAIATDGQGTVGILQFNPTTTYPQGDITIQEFVSGQFAIWLPVGPDGNVADTPMLLQSNGQQYINNGFINEICTTSGRIRVSDETPEIGGCVAISDLGIFYVPEEAKNTIFTSLMFMEGAGLPVEKVFDNTVIKIYEVNY